MKNDDSERVRSHCVADLRSGQALEGPLTRRGAAWARKPVRAGRTRFCGNVGRVGGIVRTGQGYEVTP